MESYKVSVPEGESGLWKVEQFTVSKEDASFERMRSLFRGGRYVPEGTYTRLTRGGRVIMSDTPDEIRDHSYIIRNAKGHVLINGLGIGMVLQACLEKPRVTKVTVIEKSPDVIDLVAPHYRERYGDKVEIIQADAFEWKPPKDVRYGAVWHDIWDNICGDNLPEMHKLHRKYGRRTDWQGSWGRELCERQNKSGW